MRERLLQHPRVAAVLADARRRLQRPVELEFFDRAVLGEGRASDAPKPHATVPHR